MTTRRAIFAACLLAACLAGWAALPGCDGRGRDAREEVVVYCSVNPDFARGILADFERQTGLRVLARFDEEASKTTGLVQRLRAESARPAADVFWSSEIFQTIRLADDGVLAAWSGEATRSWPARFIDPQRRWTALALRWRVIAYNTRRVADADAPRRLEDLLPAKWKGRVVMARPQFGTTRGDVASWFAHYGPDRAREILRALKVNGVRFVQGNSTAVRAVARGEADVALTDTDDVHVARRNNWPIAMNPLDQGGAGALAIPNTVALVRGSPHPAAAAKLLAFLLSEKVECDLARSESRNVPVRAHLAAKFPDLAVAKCLDVDYRKIAEHMPAAMAAVREIFD